MIRVTKLADYGILLMTWLAYRETLPKHRGKRRTAPVVATETGLPTPTVSKLLRIMTRAGLLDSQRGATGGYALAREPSSISMADIIQAIEGPIALMDCLSETSPDCDVVSLCPTRTNWDRINQAILSALDGLVPLGSVPHQRLSRHSFSRHSFARPQRRLFRRPATLPRRPMMTAPPDPTAAAKPAANAELKEIAQKEYEWGFVTDIEQESLPPGLDEDVVRFISAKKSEPEWLLEWRLEAYRAWLKMTEPDWALVHYPPIDYQKIIYFAAPKSDDDRPKSLDEVDPELLATYEKLGIPLSERAALAGVAVDAVFDSVSVATTFKSKLAELGIIFSPFSEAVREHPELVRKYLGSVVPRNDNYFAALNSAVFSDGSFVYIPKGVRCPMELSTYFRINAANTGQFERTLIVADEGAYVSYLEGCTAPMRDENQLHAAIVEIVAHDDAQVKYSTVQNWYPGDKNGVGGIFNFVTKRGACRGDRSKISWTQVETGSAITWKYPSCILQGDDSIGEFYSVALTNNYQQADTGTKMINIGKNTRSTIISKGISAGKGQNTYRGQVQMMKGAENARNYSQCDSLLLGDECGAHTFPYIEVKNPSAHLEHEASTSKIGEDQIFYLNQRGLDTESAIGMIVNGFCKQVFRELPMEFAVEAQKLLSVSLEGAVG